MLILTTTIMDIELIDWLWAAGVVVMLAGGLRAALWWDEMREPF